MTPLLDVRGLRVEIATRRGTVRAVDDVSFTLERGEALGLVGESGSGKTMTLRAILGLLPHGARITAGDVMLEGENLASVSPERLREIRGRRIAMIFQEPSAALDPVMRVGPQIAEGPATQLGLDRAAARARAVELMALTGIPAAGTRSRAYPHELSGGMRQRVMIASALASEPAILLCDEPTTALDVTIQDQVLRLLAELRVRRGLSLVYVTHDLAVVAQTCERLAVMYAGRLVETGFVDHVFRRPLHPYTLGLLRAVVEFDTPRQELEAVPGSPPDPLHVPSGCPFHPRCRLALADCVTGPVELVEVTPDHSSACIRHHLLLHERSPLPDA